MTFDAKNSTYFTFYVGHSTRQGNSLPIFQYALNREHVGRRSTMFKKNNSEAIGTQNVGANLFQVSASFSKFAGNEA